MPGRNKAVTQGEVRHALFEAEAPVMTTSKIAEEFEASRPTVSKRLNELAEGGHVCQLDTGNAVLWYLPELGDREVIEREAPESADVDTIAGYEPTKIKEPEEEPEVSTAGGATGELVDELTEFRAELNQSQARLTDRLETIEERVAQQENAADAQDAAPETWGERAEEAAADGWYAGTRLSVLLPVTLILWASLPAGIKSYALPVFGSVGEVVLGVGGIAAVVATYAIIYWGFWRAAVWTGAADRLEESTVGEIYRRVATPADD